MRHSSPLLPPSTALYKMEALSTNNYSLYSIPVTFLLAQAFSTRWALRRYGLDNNVFPREDFIKAEKRPDKIKPRTLLRIKRRYAVHQNSLEQLPFYFTILVRHSPSCFSSFTCTDYSRCRSLPILQTCQLMISTTWPFRTAF